MKPAISIRHAANHSACRGGLVNFIKHYLPDYDFAMFLNGRINHPDLIANICTLVDVDALRELHTLKNNSTNDLIWALRKIGLPDEILRGVLHKTAIFAAESVLYIFEKHKAYTAYTSYAVYAAYAAYAACAATDIYTIGAVIKYSHAACEVDTSGTTKKQIRDYLITLLEETDYDAQI